MNDFDTPRWSTVLAAGSQSTGRARQAWRRDAVQRSAQISTVVGQQLAKHRAVTPALVGAVASDRQVRRSGQSG